MHTTYAHLKGFLIDENNPGGCGQFGNERGDSFHVFIKGDGDFYGNYNGDGSIKVYAESPDGNGYGDGGDDDNAEYGVEGNGGMDIAFEFNLEKDD